MATLKTQEDRQADPYVNAEKKELSEAQKVQDLRTESESNPDKKKARRNWLEAHKGAVKEFATQQENVAKAQNKSRAGRLYKSDE